MNISGFLRKSTQQLRAAGIESARLDTLILLEDVTGHNRASLLAHGEDNLSEDQICKLNSLLARRLRREPLAYIRGTQEFYRRDFTVTPDVLIPRPETETLIEQLISLSLPTSTKILDVGTGSGVIGITCSLELPSAEIDACDISQRALSVAKYNVNKLAAKVRLFKSDLLDNCNNYHVIIANLPYVDPTWECSPETQNEPRLALFADDDGLQLIKKLIDQSVNHLLPRGYLLLEADPRQHQAILAHAKAFVCVTKVNYAIVLQLHPQKQVSSTGQK